MNKAFPDFSTHGYQVIRELGYNSLGGRVTYRIRFKFSIPISLRFNKDSSLASTNSDTVRYPAAFNISILRSVSP
ncbi:MAG: hypothetical protein EAZ10_22080 [Oscillatoriales cyanobacterium]|nr:MAG: hypothetical protein EAZ10_22080 [Oscillatoriales cyanobacterium]